jgi:hypothetical protein
MGLGLIDSGVSTFPENKQQKKYHLSMKTSGFEGYAGMPCKVRDLLRQCFNHCFNNAPMWSTSEHLPMISRPSSITTPLCKATPLAKDWAPEGCFTSVCQHVSPMFHLGV